MCKEEKGEPHANGGTGSVHGAVQSKRSSPQFGIGAFCYQGIPGGGAKAFPHAIDHSRPEDDGPAAGSIQEHFANHGAGVPGDC